MGGANFFGQLETVNVVPGLYDGQVHGVDGCNALVVAAHVALVCSS
jgi:hypothetical protein